MRLNKKHRNAFVRAVLADVPSVDYDRQIQVAMRDMFKGALPAAVRTLLRDDECAHHIHHSRVPGPKPGQPTDYCHLQPSYLVPGYWDRDARRAVIKANAQRWEDIRGLVDAKVRQEDQRQQLHGELRALIESCRTTQQAEKLMPELRDYLPTKQQESADNLPATQVVTHLQSAGWPKERKK